MNQETEILERLEKLGMKSAAIATKSKIERKKKMAIAYEHYRFVRQEKIEEFRQKVQKERGQNGWYKSLIFTRLENYQEIPPVSVLDSLEKATEKKCFDYFEIAHIELIKDPILFGRINDCPDRFFVDQWDNDLSIDQILKPNEG